MSKAKGRDREEVPVQIRRLRKMWDVALSYQLDGTVGTASEQSADANSVLGEDILAVCKMCTRGPTAAEPISTCSMCLLAWHTSCNLRVAEHLSQLKCPV
eukprot:7843700-Alexandrium_andersonii.AAC.1